MYYYKKQSVKLQTSYHQALCLLCKNVILSVAQKTPELRRFQSLLRF